jgi:hypothetical protein
MIYTAPCVMLFDAGRIHYLGKWEGIGPWKFLGPVKWHRADRQVPFGAQKTQVTLTECEGVS